ncbi:MULTISPECIES: ferrous iron transport protein B [Myroides]|uniref:Ferrous iron transport protein B n=2 Tax=Myroides odoratimimus TaxID=76832 RepID=A0AAI8G525_9FLAO|nr:MULTISPECIES: ferrous iron transport protein B [Myroides]ALU26316.1 ferrous iron transporter B [Myroides odoratimimus]EHO12204.1 ferrous iron transporter B [Myroides odoratimimus CCUG 10230]MCS7475019.1 ferrous iron transport protein B [Myroides odoratimimus]MDM1034167.1 ferrous iron transport protein B [Myroides odoratimimus]MDM1037634.1 ferrous iron transport protein B [Myroides odoratimimus]
MAQSACDICDLNATAELKKLGESSGKFDYTIALAGNPNTGKSTIFNALTGLKQHTGNWPGKTVTRAEGNFQFKDSKYKIIDLPGTYSLMSTSEDEEVARDFILFGRPNVTVVVVDAGRLERHLSLVVQIQEITNKVVVCLNLMDEAQRHGVEIDVRGLSRDLGVPVIPTSARRKEGITDLLVAIDQVATGKYVPEHKTISGISGESREAVQQVASKLLAIDADLPSPSWLAMRLIQQDTTIQSALVNQTLSTKVNNENIKEVITLAAHYHEKLGLDYSDNVAGAIFTQVSKTVKSTVKSDMNQRAFRVDRMIDNVVTSKRFGFPIMLLMLGGILWLTIIGSNYPSSALSTLLLEELYPILKSGAESLHFPWWLSGFLVDGVYLATAWVIAVMLPPMAIFFPLFTLLEDFGYLPRVAFNLDRLFKGAGAHGKQALTMSMGFGCNAAGVVSTRIINSPREKLIAIITNNFSLCNGRWPTQILMASIFIGALVPSYLSNTISTLAVVGIVVLGIGFTFFTSWMLSKTMLKGQASFFTLELPPYRPPRVLQTIYTSLIDRTLIVLWRAIVFAAPAGAVIWLICNIDIGDKSIALWTIQGLDPIGIFLGLNGVILLAYIVAIPANEIVIPTVLMLTAMVLGDASIGEGAGVMFEVSDGEIATILHMAGWTTLTGVNLMLFSLLHNPCSTTIYTIYKETNSVKWTTIASLLPVLFGVIVCFVVAQLWYLFT